MINRKEFDLLLQEIFQIENKIEELKVIKQFDKASRYEEDLKQIRSKAESETTQNLKDLLQTPFSSTFSSSAADCL